MIIKSGLTNDEVRALCDGTTDEHVLILIPLVTLTRLNIFVSPSLEEGDSAWVQVALLRSKL